MPVKVLVVDDSSFFRRRVSDMLTGDARFTVVGMAINGEEAVAKTKELRPDVITMDVEMPVMDGITAVKQIMAVRPTPILMFSSLTREGAKATFDALEAGAVDYLPKNFEDISKKQDEVARVLRGRVWSIGIRGLSPKRPAQVTTTPIPASEGNLAKSLHTQAVPHVLPRPSDIQEVALVAIGASTGGPVAVQNILFKLPERYPVPIVLVQHMPQSFTAAFAERLDKLCAIHIKEAEHGDVLQPATVYIAPGGKQMRFRRSGKLISLQIQEGDPNHNYKPCVDITFDSLASVIPERCLGIILTGMGADGREGAKKMKNKGDVIWAQDEESCVIYGMPMAVVKSGIVDNELSLEDIGNSLKRVSKWTF